MQHHRDADAWTPTEGEVRYAEWFAWAQHVLGFPAAVAHEAARAAVAADPAGLNQKEGQDAARYVKPGSATPPGPPISTFSEWFAWARNGRGFDPPTAERMATAATVAALAGATQNQSMAAALGEVEFDPKAPGGYAPKKERGSHSAWMHHSGPIPLAAIFAPPLVAIIMALLPYPTLGLVAAPAALVYSFFRLSNPKRFPRELVLMAAAMSLIACLIVLVKVGGIRSF